MVPMAQPGRTTRMGNNTTGEHTRAYKLPRPRDEPLTFRGELIVGQDVIDEQDENLTHRRNYTSESTVTLYNLTSSKLTMDA